METEDGIERKETDREAIYRTACAKMRGIRNAGMQQEAIDLLKTISGYADADERIALCEQRIKALQEQENAARIETEHTAKKRRTAAVIALSALAFCAVGTVLLFTVILPAVRYGRAKALYEAGRYADAIAAFEAMDGYRDSDARIMDCRYGLAGDLYAAGVYDEAAAAFAALDGYRDSAERVEACGAAAVEQTYAAAIALREAGRADEAYPMLLALNGYRDSEQQAAGIYEAYKAARLKSAAVGETVLFGAYEQDNDPENGKEDIEWIVLARENGRILAVSRYALDCQQYSSSLYAVSWETCSCKRWLNTTFLNDAFSADEQEKLNGAAEKVFLLSQPEVYQYFGADEARRCIPTAYAIARGAKTSTSYTVDGKGTCWWWLRWPYSSDWHAACVNIDGSVYHLDADLYLEYNAIRPAVWIETD